MDGAALEREVERILAADGYDTKRNTRVLGRSGGTHEIDVLAEKSDAIGMVRVAIECKDWTRPINKDVLAKAAWIRDDAGIHKTIVVTSSGWTTGAEKAARDQGIELWGPEELERHLRRVGMAPERPVAPPRRRTSRFIEGFPPTVTADAARPHLERACQRSWLGKPKENLVWTSLVWLPAHRMRFSFRFQKRRSIYADERIYVFEALGGRTLFIGGDSPQEVETSDLLLPVLVDAPTLSKEILKAADKYWHLKTESARMRHRAFLSNKLIPLDMVGLSVLDSSPCWLPFHVGLYQGVKGGERVVAVNAIGGQVAPVIGDALTHVTDLLRT